MTGAAPWRRLLTLPMLKMRHDRLLRTVGEIPRSHDRDRQQFAQAYVEKVAKADFSEETYKSHFRGVAYPALTRLHFFRSTEDGDWHPAPNWRALCEAPDRSAFAALVAKDLLVNRLGWQASHAGALSLQALHDQAPPRGDGASARERAAHFRSYLLHEKDVIQADNPEGGTLLNIGGKAPDADDVYAAFSAAIGGRRIVGLDHVRDSMMSTFRNDGILMASFSLDRLLIRLAREREDVVPLRAGAVTLEALVSGGNAYSAMKMVKT